MTDEKPQLDLIWLFLGIVKSIPITINVTLKKDMLVSSYGLNFKFGIYYEAQLSFDYLKEGFTRGVAFFPSRYS